jgi:hypothetical protein
MLPHVLRIQTQIPGKYLGWMIMGIQVIPEFSCNSHVLATLRSGFKSKEEAEKFLEELNMRNTTPWGEGHKQVYWIEK